MSFAGEPEGDAPKVQETMLAEQVLDVAHRPRITFDSTAVALESRQGPLLELSSTLLFS